MERTLATLGDLAIFARDFVDFHMKGAVVGLSGELGAGKTTFVRQCVDLISWRSNAETPKVTSPSYVLHQSYAKLKPPIEHFDLYRTEIKTEEDLVNIGYFEAIEKTVKKNGFVFVEWPEKCATQEWLRLTRTLTIEIREKTRFYSF